MPICIGEQKKRIQERIEKSIVISNASNTEESYALFKREHIIPHLKNALKRIEDGTYGICVGCQKKIPEERLRSVPGADCCISCQKGKEVKIG